MSGGLIDKVYIGLDNAPAAFDIKGRLLGPVSSFIFALVFLYYMIYIYDYNINMFTNRTAPT